MARTSMKRTLRRGVIAVAALTALLAATPAGASGPGPVWVTYWTGDGTPDTAAGFGADGTWTGTPAYTAGPGGSDVDDQAFSFDGSNHVNGDPALGNFGTKDFLINLRMSSTHADEFQHDLASTRAICGTAPFWQLFMGGNGEVGFSIHATNGDSTGISSPVPVNDGAFHDIVILRTGGTLAMRVDGQEVSTPIAGSGDFTILNTGLNLGGGNPCVNVAQLRPFVGVVDFLYTEQGQDPDGQDLSLTQDSTPTVAAGDSGTLIVDRNNLSESWDDGAVAGFDAPAGVQFTDARDVNSTCQVVSPTRVECPLTAYGAGQNPIALDFTVDPGVAPGSTLSVIGNFTNRTNTDPDQTNNTNVPLAINVATQEAVPIVDPMVGGITAAALIVLTGGAWSLRRRRTMAFGSPA